MCMRASQVQSVVTRLIHEPTTATARASEYSLLRKDARRMAAEIAELQRLLVDVHNVEKRFKVNRLPRVLWARLSKKAAAAQL